MKEALGLNIRTFWFLNRSLDRLRAEDDYHMAVVFAEVMAGEKFGDFLTALRGQIGKMALFDEAALKIEERLDRVGLSKLRSMGRTNR